MGKIPAGKSGEWEVIVEPDQVALIHHHPRWGDLNWMTHSRIERMTNDKFHRIAKGDVLIAGLGLGYNIGKLNLKPEVRSITVVEREQDVINLVWEHVKNPKTTLVHNSILCYLQLPHNHRQFNTIFFDIFGGMGELEYPEEVEILKDAAMGSLRIGGEILFWRGSMEVEL